MKDDAENPTDSTPKECVGCKCVNCRNTMWDGQSDNCFHCEGCTKGDVKKTECSSHKTW